VGHLSLTLKIIRSMGKAKSIEEIGLEANQLINCANEAIQWVNQHGDAVAKTGINNALKKARRNLKKVNKASSKRPAVAIFGQSQVGKSYLVQNLTKPANDTYLQIEVIGKDQPANFLTDMNPIGGKESTGTVTRFTLEKGKGTSEYPFKVELFEQLDIAAILANAYLSDIKDISYERSSENTETVRERFLKYIVTQNVEEGITEDDTHLFSNYIQHNFKGSILVNDLIDAGYFTELIQNLTKIPFDSRVKVLELLWNKNEFISDLFLRLSNTIKTLKFSDNVYVDELAIAPNDSTILDVARVNEMYLGDDHMPKVNVLLTDGSRVSVVRSEFGAITKEVELCIANSFQEDNDRSFIELCDVLDFPGSKSREKVPEKVFESNTPEQKLQLFIRGKVSFLFDAYSENQGVSSLMYCMDNNPPEEKEAPERLKSWINRYVGYTSEERKDRVNEIETILKEEGINTNAVSPLMVVLTKFNVEMDKVVPGKELDEGYHDAKWYARLEENFTKFMHLPVEDTWIHNWNGDNKKFSYVFPMRDPLHSQTTFEGFDKNNKETNIRPERLDTVKAMGESFLNSVSVQNLIPEPELAWNELITPNGSGISHLCKYLTPATHPAVTSVRLDSELRKGKRDLINTLKPHLVSGNLGEDLAKAKLESNLSWTALMGLSIRPDALLSLILGSMVVSDVEIWKLLYDFKFSYDVDEQGNNNDQINMDAALSSFSSLGIVIKKGQPLNEILESIRSQLFPSYSDDQIKETIESMTGIHIVQLVNKLNAGDKVDRGEDFDEKVIEFWHQKMLSAAQNEKLMGQLNDLQRDSIVSVINEIVKGRNRFKLGDKISRITKSLVVGTIETKDFDLVASCCTSILNKYLFSAGWHFSTEEEKPVLVGTNEKIFSNKSIINQEMKIDDYSSKKEERGFLHQWAMGCKQLYEENVRYEHDVEESFDTAANDELNKIINELS
tara:strand:+ start:3675 stop:6548 length:2874 start_codon:yes stop_codon:yes gene_type:complete